MRLRSKDIDGTQIGNVFIPSDREITLPESATAQEIEVIQDYVGRGIIRDMDFEEHAQAQNLNEDLKGQ